MWTYTSIPPYAFMTWCLISYFTLPFTAFRPDLGPTHPPIQWVPGVKRLDRETDHSPPSGADVRNGGGIPLLPHTSLWRDA
jgi:hypothetical protein